MFGYYFKNLVEPNKINYAKQGYFDSIKYLFHWIKDKFINNK